MVGALRRGAEVALTWVLPLTGLGGALWGALAGPPVEGAFRDPPRPAFTEVDSVLELDPCLDEVLPTGGCEGHRRIFVDHGALGGPPGGVWIAYDFDRVTRPIAAAELQDEGELSLAVRLIISEVGADRLLHNRLGLAEAVGILYTVQNRLDPLVSNPLDQPRAPRFEGCGPEGAFVTCANAGQYLGMATTRALDPAARYGPAMLEPAADVAVLAWHLVHGHLVDDPTEGATNYVHRCGGVAYGQPTWACDAHVGGKRRDDVRGANPHTGPLVFKAPTVYLPRKGFYGLRDALIVDYVPADHGDGVADGGGRGLGSGA